MAKQCPKDHNHHTREVKFEGLTYDLCTVCQEDVEQVQREMDKAKNPAPAPVEAEDEEPELNLGNEQPVVANDEDFEEVEDDGDDDAGHNPFQNPPGFNPRPVRNMGNATGTHKVVLRNDDNTGHMVVESVLSQVFGKDRNEANYVMNHVHYNGESDIFYLNPADWPALQAQIETIKQQWIRQGCPPEHVNGLNIEMVPR